MASNEFKEALKAGKLKEALLIAMSQGMELNITTTIASSNYENQQLGNNIETKINLIKGEIENVIGENLMANNLYQEINKFHFQQVMEANEMIKNNLETMETLFALIIAMQQQQNGKNQNREIFKGDNPQYLSSYEEENSSNDLKMVGEIQSFPFTTQIQPAEESAIARENQGLFDDDDEELDRQKSIEDEKLADDDYFQPIGELDFQKIDYSEMKSLSQDSDEDDILSIEDFELEEEESLPEDLDEITSFNNDKDFDSNSIPMESNLIQEESDDEDWGDFFEQESENLNIDPQLEENQESWQQWNLDESESISTVPNFDSLDLEDDEDWEEFEESLPSDSFQKDNSLEDFSSLDQDNDRKN